MDSSKFEISFLIISPLSKTESFGFLGSDILTDFKLLCGPKLACVSSAIGFDVISTPIVFDLGFRSDPSNFDSSLNASLLGT